MRRPGATSTASRAWLPSLRYPRGTPAVSQPSSAGLQQFDDRLVEQNPAVGVLGAWVHALRGRPAAADRWGDLAERGTFEGTLPDGSTSIEPWLALLRAKRCRGGVDQMQLDAKLSLERIARTSQLRPTALLTVGFSYLLAGDDETADGYFAQTVEAAAAAAVTDAGCVALAERALLAINRGCFNEAEGLVRDALELADAANLTDYATTTIVLAASARIALHGGDSATARANLATAQRLRPQLTHALPWFATQTLLELARSYLALADVAGASTLLAEAEEIIRLRPGLGVLVEQARGLRGQVSRGAEPEGRWASTLTSAELRLLPLLTTHLSFREIAERLHVSRNTVKAQAISMYRKLGVTSRSEAIAHAAALGLVEAPVIPVPHDFIPTG